MIQLERKKLDKATKIIPFRSKPSLIKKTIFNLNFIFPYETIKIIFVASALLKNAFSTCVNDIKQSICAKSFNLQRISKGVVLTNPSLHC